MVIWLLLQMLMDPGVIHSAGLGGWPPFCYCCCPRLKWRRGSAPNVAQGCCLLMMVMEELRLSWRSCCWSLSSCYWFGEEADVTGRRSFQHCSRWLALLLGVAKKRGEADCYEGKVGVTVGGL
jgi:hypothetical protein